MKRIFLLLALALFVSCNKKVVFKDTIKQFPENRWAASDVKTFDFTLKHDVEPAEIQLHFSHVFDPQYTTVPLSVTITNPSGEQENIFVNMQLKDGSGESLSECAGDVCDYTTTIKEGAKMAKGKYKITVQNKYEHEYLPNILAFGVSVKHEG